MRCIKYILPLLVLLLMACANASPISKSNITITGLVNDMATSSPVANAQISVISLRNNYTTKTDSHGKYNVKIELDKPYIAIMMASKTGYRSSGKLVLLMPNKNYSINLSLKDICPPTIRGLLINDGAIYTNSEQAILTIDAKDEESGVYFMSFSSNGKIWSIPEPYKTTRSWQLAPGDGLKTVYARVKDRSGNWSKQSSDSIIYRSNCCPVIEGILPDISADIIKGAEVTIRVKAKDADNDPLEYRFVIDGNERQSWGSSPEYAWSTIYEDEGSHVVICEVRDKSGEIASKNINYIIKDLTVEEILQKAADNYRHIYDFRAETSLFSTYDGQPFGEVEYCIYYFMKPNKEKIETYTNAQRQTQIDNVMILCGSDMYLVNPSTKEIETSDLLAEAGINDKQFSQMDVYYNLPDFINAHSISKNDAASDYKQGVVAIDVVPKETNNLYTQLRLLVDFNKGLIVKSLLYKENNLIQIISTTEFIQMPNGAWLPKTMTKQPIVSSGEFITVMEYEDISINLGLTELDFDPNKQ